MLQGIDVSSFQSTTYDTTGLAFVFVKATQGTTYVNPKMGAQVARARAAGLVVGYYHFLMAGNPAGQAAYFVQRAQAQPGDILACDWETAPDGTYPTCADKDAFLREVKRLAPHNRVVLYANRDFWLNRDTTSYAGDGLWIADPSSPEGSPQIRSAWLFQQYSVSGGIDRDTANFSTREALATWASAGAPAAPSSPNSGGGTVTTPSSDDIYAAVWLTDKVPAPPDAPDVATNPTWQAVNTLRDAQMGVREALARLDIQSSKLDAQAGTLAALQTRLDAVVATLAQLDASGALRAALDGSTATLTLHTGGTTP